MQLITIHCQPSLLSTIKDLDLEYTESPQFGEDEYDVQVVDYDNLDDKELCSTIGLDYNEVNCIELT